MQRRSIILSILTAFLLMACSAISWGQTITGSVNGTVTDSTGAIVPNAKVTASNADTGINTDTTTNSDGIYNIRFLQIGRYKITVSAPGFGDTTYGPFTLETGQNAKIDSHLTIAGQQQKVQVQAEIAPLLNTENPTLATTLDNRAIENVPLVSRNLTAITMFLPGSVSTQPNSFVSNAAVSGPLSSNNPAGASSNASVSVNGNRQQANQYLLDGMNINQTLDDELGYNPSVDAIGQVQVISANANAEYGNVNGGDILYQTKSGTNNWHGSLFYFLGNFNLDANSWVNNFTHIAKNSYTRNLFGGTFGGPILKDKLFFFVDYQGGRFHSGGQSQASVYTPLMRTGDFSELLNPAIMGAGKTVQLYDATQPGHPAYANNRIPVTNPAALYLFAHPELYPLPNAAPNPGSPTQNNYHGLQKERNYGDQFDAKVDWKISDKDNMFVRYSQDDSGQTTQSALLTSFNSAPTYPVRGVAINEVHQFSSSIVNEFRAGYTRIQDNGAVLLDPSGQFGLNGNSLLGIGANNPQAQAFAGFSALGMQNSNSPQGFSAGNGSSDFTLIGNANGGTNYTLNTFLYGDNLTWSKDRHTFKFGAQFQRQQQNNFYPGNDGSLGGFYFLGAGTSNGASGGYTGADFVLNRAGFVSKGGVSGPVGMRSWRDAYFAQDDWKISPTLTLNLGIRYEYIQPIYEVNNKMSTIDPNNPSVVLLAGSTQAQAAGYNRALVDPYYGGVMPRIGFSWQAQPRLVVRGGYGIQNFMEGTGANLRMTTNLPFQGSYQASGVQPNAATGTPGNFFDVQDGFGIPNPSGGASGVVYNVWNKKIKPAFIGEYSLTLEYQLSNTASFQIGYLGESGQHLITANQRNQLQAPCVLNGVVQTFPSAGQPQPAGCPKSPFQDTPGVGYTGVVRYTDSNAMMNYNSLQASFRQRLSRGLQYTANYTYSRAMTNSIGFYGAPGVSVSSAYAENVYNLHNEYGPTGQDVRNALNFNLVYDLPLGRGRRFGANMPLALDEVVGGWKIGMTGVAYSGFPVSISTSSNNSAVNGNSQRPNHYRELKIVNRSINNWFGTDPSAVPCTTPGVDNGVCAYGQPALGTFGTAPPDSERAPSFQTYGASVTKDFTIWREHQINFRADADNLFNSAFLGNPQNNILNTQFGNIINQSNPIRSNPRQMQLSVKYHF
ncbi:TonB-dependent receptor [Granulicella sp. WH15]|uniref:TonB-dependent receptor n=1 Tax=Granulicella sp. WH15 TaxID=2602070 RepID=UPI0013674E9C|nr:TonB-dependent receptor [Granulicella sp. WH15]QHN02917.1 TonB-dependent receptor [Granulicella sp. WH15]